MRDVRLHLSWGLIAKSLLVIGLIWLVAHITDVVLTLAFALVAFAALLPVVEALDRRLPRAVAVAMVLGAGLLLLAIFVYVLIPPLVAQTQQLVASFPGYVGRVGAWIGWLTGLTQRYAWMPDLGHLIGTLPARIATFLQSTLGWTVAVASAVMGTVTTLIISVFLLGDTRNLMGLYLSWFPHDRRDRVREVTQCVLEQVGAYVRGQALVMTAVGVLTGMGLALVGVDYAAALGLLVGLLDIIPMVGPVIAAVPGLLIALGQSPTTALLALGVYVVAQQIESQLLAPLIVGKAVGLPPVVILVSLLIGGALLGVVGVILAVPAAAAVQVLVRELYLKRLNPPEEPVDEETGSV